MYGITMGTMRAVILVCGFVSGNTGKWQYYHILFPSIVWYTENAIIRRFGTKVHSGSERRLS